MKLRDSYYALRVTRRNAGDAAIIYRRQSDTKNRERLTRFSAISPLAFLAGSSLIRGAVKGSEGPKANPTTGPFHPLTNEWGARVGCYAMVTAGIRDPHRLARAAQHLVQADSSETTWWLGLMLNTCS